jgi:hypothetical protein
MQRVISLPAIRRTVTIGQYVTGVKFAIANPAAEFTHGLTTWWAVTGAEIRQQFHESLHDRINAAQPYSSAEPFRPAPPRGRKDCRDWFVGAWRDSRRCRDIARRIVVREFETAEARKRLGHLLTRD